MALDHDHDSALAEAALTSGSVTVPARPSPHRSPPLQLPADSAEAAAYVLRFIQLGDSAFDRSAALEAMRLRVGQLANVNGERAIAELAGHAALLDSLALRWSALAVMQKKVDHQAKLAKLGLASQAAYTRTIVAIAGLQAAQRGAALIKVEDS